MEYPKDDKFEDCEINGVTAYDGGGWEIRHGQALCFFVPPESPVEPKIGMTARFYGNGMGFSVRGLFLDGIEVFYRTESEEKEHNEIQMYGADAADMLRKWDAGDTVHTIEMGGLGPGYEQALQIAMFEILRFLLAEKPDPSLWEDSDIWREWRDKLYDLETLKGLGLSGAQAGAALSLATGLYMRGPRTCLKEVLDSRHTMVSKHFPQAPETAERVA